MSSTIDNINAGILEKFSLIQEMILIYNTYELDNNDINILKNYYNIINEQRENYKIDSVNLKIKFYNEKNKKEKIKHYKKYTNYIINNNIIGDIDRFFRLLNNFRSKYIFSSKKLTSCISKFKLISINLTANNLNNNICDCGNKLTIEAKTSEFQCKKCGKCIKLYGTVFEDDQFWLQEGQRTKHGKYDPTKHCKFWIDRIQAKENAEIPDKVINVIKKCLRRDNIWIDQLNCSIIRGYLKSNKLSSYNDHVPLIKKIITGKEPEQLTDVEFDKTCLYFSKIIQIYNKIKPDNKPNCPYHPFFIFKILENIIDNRIRKNNILSCIHLQSRETLIENDRIWKLICEHLDDFTYKPTEAI